MSESSEEKRFIVFARTYREFVFWCEENKVNSRSRFVRYIVRPNSLLGLRPGDWTVVNLGYPFSWSEAHIAEAEFFLGRIRSEATGGV